MSHVIDASALLAAVQNEVGAETVRKVIAGSVISSVNWSEVHSKVLIHGVNPEKLKNRLEGLGLGIEPFSVEDADIAGSLIIKTKPLGLSLGDRACLALALRLHKPVLTAEKIWLKLSMDVTIQAIC
jgi:PIN domain nuclease of toxin-antitoxin system